MSRTVYLFQGFAFENSRPFAIDVFSGIKNEAIISEFKKVAIFNGIVSQTFEDPANHIGIIRDSNESIIKDFKIFDDNLEFSRQLSKTKIVYKGEKGLDGVWIGTISCNNLCIGTFKMIVNKNDIYFLTPGK